MNWRQGQ